MLRVAVVDDEQEMREKLCEYLSRYAYEEALEFKVEKYSNGFDLFSQQVFADIIFLDIEMDNMNGMEVAKKIRSRGGVPVIIFVTRMAQYAVEGYAVEALDFIVKPVRYETFYFKMRRAVEHAQKICAESIVVTVGYGKVRLNTAEILYVEVIGHKLIYHTEQGEVESWDSMKNACAMLGAFGFALCSVSYLVNLRKVMAIKNGEVTVGDTVLKVSRYKKESFLDALASFMR